MKKFFKRKIFWLPLFFVICIGILFSLGLDDVFFSEHEIKIGVIAELSGPMKQVGIASQHAVTLAVSQVNAAGGILIDGNRFHVRLITLDNKSSISETQKDVEQLNDNHVTAIIGPNISTYALAAGSIAEKKNIVLMSPWSTDNNLTHMNNKTSPYVFRAGFTKSFQENALAYFASNILQAGSAAVIYDARQSVLKQEADLFSSQFKNYHGIIVDIIGFTNPQNINQQLTSLSKKNPNIIFVSADAQDAAIMIHAVKMQDSKVPIIESDEWNDGQLLTVCNLDCNGVYVSSHMNSQNANKITQDFMYSYKKQFKIIPDDIAALSYDATNILLQAIRKAGTSHDDIAQAIHTIENYTGVTGNITYTSNSNDPQKEMFINKIENGNLVFVQAISPKNIQK